MKSSQTLLFEKSEGPGLVTIKNVLLKENRLIRRKQWPWKRSFSLSSSVFDAAGADFIIDFSKRRCSAVAEATLRSDPPQANVARRESAKRPT